MILPKWPIPAKPKIALHRTLTAPHFPCQVEQTQTSQLSDESSSVSLGHFWVCVASATTEKPNLLFDVRRQIVFQRSANTLCKQPPFYPSKNCDLIKMKMRGVHFSSGWARRNQNHMRKYSPVFSVKCAHERRNSNQIGFLWQTITFILKRQHFFSGRGSSSGGNQSQTWLQNRRMLLPSRSSCLATWGWN